jgi:flagellar assembly protein FliH
VDGEEKNSLHKNTSSLDCSDKCVYHCFPAIPVRENGMGKRKDMDGEKFRRVACIHIAGGGGPMVDLAAKREGTDDDSKHDLEEVRKEAFAKGYAQGKKEAYDKGLRDGTRQGIKEGQAAVAPLIEDLSKAAREMDKVKRQLMRRTEQETVSLAMAVARKIIGSEVSTSDKALTGIVKQALQRVSGNETIRIRMNPEDVQRMEDLRGDLSVDIEDNKTLQFIADKSITSGGCLIETEMGSIDARIEKQLQVVEDAFQSEIRAAAAGGE